MGELLAASWLFVLPGLLPVLALLHVPLFGRRGRTVWAIGLAAIAVFFLGDILLFDHSAQHTLQVKTFFGGSDGQPKAFVVDEVTAPVWQWHVVASIWFGITAAYVWLVRARRPGARFPVAIAVFAFVSALGARIAFEKTAAPEEIVWAVGVSAASFAIAPFVGWYCGRRGDRFGRFALTLFVANVLQRTVLVVAGWFATTRGLGTHLDTHTIPGITVPIAGEMKFTDATDAWMRTLLVPQLTFVLLMTFVFGLLLGVLPWRFARRSSANAVVA